MPKGGILYLIMVFAPWEAIIKIIYNVLSPMGVFVLGGIYTWFRASKGVARVYFFTEAPAEFQHVNCMDLRSQDH